MYVLRINNTGTKTTTTTLYIPHHILRTRAWRSGPHAFAGRTHGWTHNHNYAPLNHRPLGHKLSTCQILLHTTYYTHIHTLHTISIHFSTISHTFISTSYIYIFSCHLCISLSRLYHSYYLTCYDLSVLPARACGLVLLASWPLLPVVCRSCWLFDLAWMSILRPDFPNFFLALLLLDTCTRTHGSRWRKLYRSPIITGLLSISHSLVSRLPLYCIHVVVRPPFSASLVFQDFYLNCDEGLYFVGFRLAHMYSCTDVLVRSITSEM